MMETTAFLSWGQWVADCPNPACTNAMGVEPGQAEFHCWIKSGVGVCGTQAVLVWPEGYADAAAALAGAPVQNQSWQEGQ